jgi:predicted XRE-type DNA-binding protein
MKRDEQMAHDEVTAGTQNIFADLGVPDAETHKLKADLVVKLRDVIDELNLTQAEAGQRIGASQPEVSRILNGRFREVSVERLIHMLTRLDCEVDILVTSRETAFAPIHLEPVSA